MPPLRGLGLRQCLVFLAILQGSQALKLDIPSNITPSETIQVAWESDVDDPPSMDLFLSCGNMPFIDVAPGISTASQSYTVNMPPAFLFSDGTVLDGVNFALDSGPTSASSISASTTSTSVASSASDSTDFPTSSTHSEVTHTSPSPSSSISTQSTTPSLTTSSEATSSTTSSIESTGTATSLPTTSSTVSTMTTSSSSASVSPTVSDSPTEAASKKPVGAIVGGVLGGILALLILLLLLLCLCRRRRLQQRLSRRLSGRPELASSPSSAEKEVKEGLLGAGAEAVSVPPSVQGESDHQRSGSSSAGDLFADADGHRTPDLLNAPLQPVRYSDNPESLLPSMNVGEQWDSQHFFDPSRASSPTRAPTTRVASPSLIGQARKLSHPSGYDEVNRSSSEILEVDKMDPEMREKRRDAILEQMRRVLDGEQIV
ncbi:hypothetical protein H0H92_008050 [Tricholoma furcatifolium]|nr:hypothetical protein H0H92_008050 [Tricholoma furcatifolium]